MNSITTHVLDTARGCPAEGVGVTLEILEGDAYRRVGHGATDADGRLRSLLPPDQPPRAGRYRIIFAVDAYHRGLGVQGFYPEVSITFELRDASLHYHVPLLISPYGYSTYRGS